MWLFRIAMMVVDLLPLYNDTRSTIFPSSSFVGRGRGEVHARFFMFTEEEERRCHYLPGNSISSLSSVEIKWFEVILLLSLYILL